MLVLSLMNKIKQALHSPTDRLEDPVASLPRIAPSDRHSLPSLQATKRFCFRALLRVHPHRGTRGTLNRTSAYLGRNSIHLEPTIPYDRSSFRCPEVHVINSRRTTVWPKKTYHVEVKGLERRTNMCGMMRNAYLKPAAHGSGMVWHSPPPMQGSRAKGPSNPPDSRRKNEFG